MRDYLAGVDKVGRPSDSGPAATAEVLSKELMQTAAPTMRYLPDSGERRDPCANSHDHRDPHAVLRLLADRMESWTTTLFGLFFRRELHQTRLHSESYPPPRLGRSPAAVIPGSLARQA